MVKISSVSSCVFQLRSSIMDSTCDVEIPHQELAVHFAKDEL